MDKETYGTYEFISCNVNNDINPLYLLKEDGTLLKVNCEIQYVPIPAVKEVAEPRNAYVNDYVNADTRPILSIPDEYLESEGNIQNIIIEPLRNVVPEPSIIIDATEPREPHAPREKTYKPKIYQAKEDNISTSSCTNFTEITLSDAQYQMLEQKGWVLLECNDKVFVLNTLGLHDITSDDKLIEKLKNDVREYNNELLTPLVNENIQNDTIEHESIVNEIIDSESIVNERTENERIRHLRIEYESIVNECIGDERYQNECVEYERIDNETIINKHIQNERIEYESIVNECIGTERLQNECVQYQRIDNETIINEHIQNERIEYESIVNECIGTERLQNECVQYQRIDNETIVNEHIQNERIEYESIVNECIGTERLQNECIQYQRIDNETIVNEHIQNERIEYESIVNECIGTERLQNECIQYQRIDNETIVNEHIQNERIEYESIVNECIGTERLQNECVQYQRIDNETIANEHIQNERIEYESIVNECIGTERLQNECVQYQRIDNETIANEHIQNERIEYESIVNECIGTERLQNECVQYQRIDNETIVNEHIQNERIEYESIVNECIGTERLQNECIQYQRIDNETIANEHIQNEHIEYESIVNECIGTERLQNECVQYQRIDNETIANEHIQNERILNERIENERIENERIENERNLNERIENERLQNERIENERILNERIENERLQNERIKNERILNERIENEKLQNERIESEGLHNERILNEPIENERIQNELVPNKHIEHIEKERIEIERIENEHIENERIEIERIPNKDIEIERTENDCDENISTATTENKIKTSEEPNQVKLKPIAKNVEIPKVEQNGLYADLEMDTEENIPQHGEFQLTDPLELKPTHDTIRIKTKHIFKGIPEKMYLGKSVNGKKLYARVTKSKYNRIYKDENKFVVYIGNKSNPSFMSEYQFINIVQNSFNEPVSPQKVSMIDTLMEQLLKLKHVSESLTGHRVILTKTTKHTTSKGQITVDRPLLIAGTVDRIDANRTWFRHIPNLLCDLVMDDDSSKEPRVNNPLVPLKHTKLLEFYHVHISERKVEGNPPQQMVHILKRKISLDVLRDSKKRHPDPMFACGACASVFKTQAFLKEHQENQCFEADDTLMIDTDKIGKSTETLYTVTMDGNEKRYCCTLCDAKFSRIFNCQKHIKTHDISNPNSDSDDSNKKTKNLFKCKMCPSTYLHSSSLSKHIVKMHINI